MEDPAYSNKRAPEDAECWDVRANPGIHRELVKRILCGETQQGNYESMPRSKLRRPEHPLGESWEILKRLNPHDKYFAAVDFSSGFSQLPLAEESHHLFNIILPWGKYRYCVLPQGLNVSPELFDINAADDIRNTDGIWKNADDVHGGGRRLEQLDESVFTVCRKRGIKLSPSKLQCGRQIKWGGVIIEG